MPQKLTKCYEPSPLARQLWEELGGAPLPETPSAPLVDEAALALALRERRSLRPHQASLRAERTLGADTRMEHEAALLATRAIQAQAEAQGLASGLRVVPLEVEGLEVERVGVRVPTRRLKAAAVTAGVECEPYRCVKQPPVQVTVNIREGAVEPFELPLPQDPSAQVAKVAFLRFQTGRVPGGEYVPLGETDRPYDYIAKMESRGLLVVPTSHPEYKECYEVLALTPSEVKIAEWEMGEHQGKRCSRCQGTMKAGEKGELCAQCRGMAEKQD